MDEHVPGVYLVKGTRAACDNVVWTHSDCDPCKRAGHVPIIKII